MTDMQEAFIEDYFFMTNTDPFDGIAEVVAQAADETGLRVKYFDHPMPFDPYDPEAFDDEGYQTYDPTWCAGMGSIATLDRGRNHSDFWEVYDRLKAERVN